MSVDTLSATEPGETAVQDPKTEPVPDREPLNEAHCLLPARGIMHGLMISMPVWLLLLAVLVWLVF